MRRVQLEPQVPQVPQGLLELQARLVLRARRVLRVRLVLRVRAGAAGAAGAGRCSWCWQVQPRQAAPGK